MLSGQYIKAIKAFDSLFKNNPPSLILALDYWLLIAKDPNRNVLALKKLEALYFKFKPLGLMKNATQQPQSWQYRLVSNIAAIWVDIGKKALKNRQYSQAKNAFSTALKRQENNYEAWVGLGDLFLQLNQLLPAEHAYQSAHTMNLNGNLALHGLIGVHKRRSPQAAINYIQSLPEFLQKKMLLRTQSLKSNVLQQKAERYKQKNQLSKAIRTLKKALTLTPNNVWLTYDLALIYKQLGRKFSGLRQLRNLTQLPQ